MKRILIVGAGVTGAITASLIRKRLLQSCHFAVWEKSSHAGGRMDTSLHSQTPWSSVDLGAQYISPTPKEYQDHQLYYKELEDLGLLVPMKCQMEGDRERPAGTKHYVAPLGMSSVVKHFLSSSGASVHYGHPVCSLHVDSEGLVATSLDSVAERYDCVVLTIPVPEVFQLMGDVNRLINSMPEVKENLQNVVYSSRYALGLFFDVGAQLGLSWSIKYFDDPIIRYIAVDNERRSGGSDRPAMVVHTTVQFGLDSSGIDADELTFNVILPQLYTLLPQLPKVAFTVTRRWQYSQVYKGFPDAPGALILNTSPLLVVGGDAFSYSKFDGCITSAIRIASDVVEFMRNNNSSELI